MDLDLSIVVAGLVVGFVVGLTGMGGGALMTPVLVLFFNISPLAAVSSDLVAAAVMKPIGSVVHMRHGTINWGLVRWLMVGSVPSAFLGVLVLRALGDGEGVQTVVKTALGAALLLAAGGLVLKAYMSMVATARAEAARARGEEPEAAPDGPVVVRPLPTLLVGAVGGLVVGMTSVGSGSLIIIALLALYPTLRANTLVGTDLVQAVPLVASAALGHVLFGDFQLDLTTSLLVGSVPGVWLGAQLSARAAAGLIRRALALVLLASALKLLGVPTPVLGVVLLVLVVAAPWVWAGVRARNGLPRRGLTVEVVRKAWQTAGARD
ncbi:sulfite exporter TauE/SafE family protein [Kineosporia sp. A_224]|uniref:sulfite exporter TauE/SafE family protein n=1 Tax=Kineosporia sp. A_224 TaxID=1962180 RepID=UPI000B4A6C37|nr:sulfite exporter TauE/SafE family protein [Kineosporia sp. A_224]